MSAIFAPKDLLFVTRGISDPLRRPTEPSLLDTSLGSDAEKCENRTPPQTPTDSEPETFLKFSIEQILSPNFGKQACLPSPTMTEPVKDETSANLFPAWVYCTRYSDRPSSGPRCRRTKKPSKSEDEKRPRTAFTSEQLARLKAEFQANRYLTEKRRQDLARELGLKESQVKIWFQNKRAKIKKQLGPRHPLAMHLMAQGLYNHTTTVKSDSEDE